MAAEMAVSFAIDHLLPLLTEEATMLRGIHKGFAEIKVELESIQAFLKDADKRAAAAADEESEGVKTWVMRVRDVAFRIEDIIDEYMIHVGQQQEQQQQQHLGCATLICKITNLIKTLKSRHQIASEIQDIKSSVREIKDRSDRYGFQRQQVGSSSREKFMLFPNREAALYIDEAQVVGFDVPRDKLIGWLVEGRAERTVISVVAMGGQGKTTLAKKVFDNQKVIEHFDCRAWITVSQSYSVEGLLRDMLQQFGNDVSTMDLRSLIRAVRNCLNQKRYVVVFDDVWNVRFWDEIQFSVIDNKNGSRILITTRKKEVVMSCKESSFVEMHELEPLTPEQSLKLFYRKAFQFDFDGRCPEDLIDISHVIVKKCNGLPLAIVTIGGVLSGREKNALEWERFSQNLSKELEKNPHLNDMVKILGFSYDDLPFHLKPCFLYFGMYPEDYNITSKKLIAHWTAEGFVKEETGEILEKVGKEYLRELICRCLVLVSEKNNIREGRVKYYHVHDVVREMIHTKFKDLSFGQFIGEGDQSISVSSRRLTVVTAASDVLMRNNKMSSHIRSLHFFLGENSFEYLVKRILAKFMLLKVLDIEDTYFDVPYDIGNLIHLKYFSFTGEFIYLPKSISKLQNLETLTLRLVSLVSGVCQMPKEVSKLRKLRHLVVQGMSWTRLKDCIGSMTSLQTLKDVIIKHVDEGELIREIGKLRQLRELNLEFWVPLSFSLNEMQNLEKLVIRFKLETVDLNLISPPPMLRKLKIHGGYLNKLPEWVPKLQNLVKLILEENSSIYDPMKSLQNMPSLLSLKLYECYRVECIHFEGGGFQKLEELHLESMDNLETIFIDKGALPSLKRLWLWELPKLKMLLPPGIKRLEKLVEIDIQQVPLEFKKDFLHAIGHSEGGNLFRA